MEVNDDPNEHIEQVVKGHPLRGFDAIHLASALATRERLPEHLIFVCFKGRLVTAAQTEEFITSLPEYETALETNALATNRQGSYAEV